MVSFQSHSGINTLEVQQFINSPIDTAWEFFSSPGNLAKITPPHMGFHITSGIPAKMYPGQIITYKVSPFPGITTNWVTEITHVSLNHYFVDEQRFGPYKMWHHEHHFQSSDGGSIPSDSPFWDNIFIKTKVNRTTKLPLGDSIE